MDSGKSDSENRHCMKFYMGQLDVPSCIMKQKTYIKSHLENSVYMISHYDSNGCVKHHSENKWQAKSRPIQGGTYKKIVLKKRVGKVYSETKRCMKFHPEAKW